MNKDETPKQQVKAIGFSSSKGLETPVEKLDKKYGFVTWGAKNDYPFYLIDMYNGSAWHQGIVKTKTYYIAGGGLKATSGNLDEFLENKHSDFSINEIAKGMTFDFEMFDGFCVIGTWNKEGTRVAVWEYYEADKVRTNADESMYFTSDDWSARKQNEDTNYREIPPLDMKNKSGKFMMYYKSPSKQAKGEKGVYPKPSYVGGITSINTDVLISQYHLFEIQNGFKCGTLVNLAGGQPETEEEARAHRDAIKGTTTDISDTNQLIITFSDGQDNAPTVMQLNGNDLADRYNMTEKSVQQNILVAHGATNPTMFGIMQEGSFNAAESQELFEIFKSVYVSARQESIEYIINKMVQLSGFQGTLELEDVEPFKESIIEEGVIEEVVDGEVVETEEPTEDVAASAMNGAQISSLVGIVEAVGLGTLTPAAAVEVIMASFPTITRAQASKIVGLDAPAPPAPNFEKQEGQVFRKSDNDLKVFMEYGISKDNFKVVKSVSVSNDFGSADVERMESNNYTGFFDTIGDIRAGLTELDKNVLALLKKGEDGTSIQNALDESMTDIAKSIDKLTRADLIVNGETSAIGEDILEGLEVEADRYEVRYSYEVKPGLGADKISTTRPFCETLIDANRMYTRQEIDFISGRIGRDVWRYRGGFYHNPKTDRTTPWCRHQWVQSLVVKQ